MRFCAMAALVAASLLGCAPDGDEEQAPPDPAAGTSMQVPASDSPATEVAEPSPQVAPATGPQVEMDHLAFTLPSGWNVAEEVSSTVVAQAPGFDLGSLTVSVFPTSNTQGEVLEIHLEARREDGKVRQLSDIDLPGCTAYRTAMFDRQIREFRYDVGCVAGLKLYTVAYTDPKGNLAKAEEIMAPVFASMEMR